MKEFLHKDSTRKMSHNTPVYSLCVCTLDPRKGLYKEALLLKFLAKIKTIAALSRLQIILFIDSSPHCIADLVTHTGLSQSLISHHLADLKEARLVRFSKSGRYTIYSLTKEGKQFVSLLKQFLE